MVGIVFEMSMPKSGFSGFSQSAAAGPDPVGSAPRAGVDEDAAGDSGPSFPSIASFAKTVRVPLEVATAWVTAIAGEIEPPLDDLANVEEADAKAAADSMGLEGPSALHRAQALKFWRACVAAFRDPPEAQPSSPVPPPAGKVKQPEPADKHKMSELFDQRDTKSFEDLDDAALKELRQRYRRITGGDSPAHMEPSATQLAALVARLANTRKSPYADFAVWGPFGDRVAGFRKFEDEVWVDGVLTKRLLKGPPSFTAWEASWEVFQVAMLSCHAASISSLRAYQAGIRQLDKLYPGKWSLILQADVIMRSEHWQRLRESYQERPEDAMGFYHQGLCVG